MVGGSGASLQSGVSKPGVLCWSGMLGRSPMIVRRTKTVCRLCRSRPRAGCFRSTLGRVMDFIILLSLGLQIAQSRSYLYTLGPQVGIMYILGALGYMSRSGPDLLSRANGRNSLRMLGLHSQQAPSPSPRSWGMSFGVGLVDSGATPTDRISPDLSLYLQSP